MLSAMTATKEAPDTATRPSVPRRAAGFSFEALGSSLKRRRLAQDLTLEQLSDRSGYAVSSIFEIESGMKVTFPKAAAICSALGVRLSTVLVEAERAVGAGTTGRRPAARRTLR